LTNNAAVLTRASQTKLTTPVTNSSNQEKSFEAQKARTLITIQTIFPTFKTIIPLFIKTVTEPTFQAFLINTLLTSQFT
jgi:hypothetical protein